MYTVRYSHENVTLKILLSGSRSNGDEIYYAHIHAIYTSTNNNNDINSSSIIILATRVNLIKIYYTKSRKLE